MPRLQIKKDSEIETLAKRLDALKQQQAQKAQQVTEAQQAQIAEVQAQLDAAQRAQWDARAAAHAAEQDAARKDYDATLCAVVEVTCELRDLLSALDERLTQCGKLGVSALPPARVEDLQRSVTGAVWWWDSFSDLTGKAQQRESKHRRAVRDAESQLVHVTALFEAQKQRVESYRGARSDKAAREMLDRMDALAAALATNRGNVVTALLALGDEMTQADQRRVEELQTADDRKVVLSW